jgi:hypothetical protein
VTIPSAERNNLKRIFYKLVSKVADMHKSILVEHHVTKAPKLVTLVTMPGSRIPIFRSPMINAFRETKYLKFFSWIPPGFSSSGRYPLT